ncbi:MAG: WYL domain-containing protein [Nocardioides sp.]|nr:WYL domain-containing protein [Nocardioides sp.]
MTKSERLLNLLILLLVQRNYITKQRIRQTIPSYREASEDAFERMFDRDKDELRALGAPVVAEATDAYFGDEVGYRIRPDDFALPGIDLTADEAAVVGLATRVWQHAGLAGATSDALTKLSAAGLEIDRRRLDIAAPVVTVADEHFDVFWQASLERIRLSFDYQRSGSQEVTRRHLEPWGVVSSSGRWYVVGQDTDRGEPRLFRLSRVRGKVSRNGKAGAYDIPAGINLRDLTRSLSPAPATETALVLVRSDAALSLRRTATEVEAGVPGPDTETGWDRLRVAYSSPANLVDDVLVFGHDACIEAPQEARELAITRLSEVVSR